MPPEENVRSTTDPGPSSAKEITSFSFSTPAATGVINGTSIEVTVPWNTDVSMLVPTIVHNGASINPASGTTQDFSSPRTYTVKATDLSSQDYLVTVIKKEYSIGEIGPAGGWVFYINPNSAVDGWKYLEAAPDTTEWAGVLWSTIDPVSSNPNIGTVTGIGTGAANTSSIVATLTGQTTIAAYLCDDLSIDYIGVTYNDWFLPSYDELYLMYTNLKAASLGNFADFDYWSSSESDNQNVKNIRFPNGLTVTNFKNANAYVRAARSF